MRNFRKTYNLKIVSVLVAITFFVSSTGYGIDLSKISHLRPQLLTNTAEKGEERLEKGMAAILNRIIKDVTNVLKPDVISRREFIKRVVLGMAASALPILLSGDVRQDRISIIDILKDIGSRAENTIFRK